MNLFMILVPCHVRIYSHFITFCADLSTRL